MSIKTILVVNDSEFFIGLIRSYVNRSDCKVLWAKDSFSATDILKREKVDLILLDFILKEVRGDEYCRTVKYDSATKNLPLIMVTNVLKEEDKNKCRDAGCDGFLYKPVNKLDLLKMMKKYINIAVRENKRAPLFTEIQYVCDGEDSRGHTFTISEGGLFIKGGRLFKKGSEITLSFGIDGIADDIKALGRVAWNTEGETFSSQARPGMGIKFISIDGDYKRAISFYVEEGNYLV